MCNHKDYADFGRLQFSWEKAMEPNGPLKSAIIEKIKRQFGNDPARWRGEMDAEWAEDEDVWLPQSLIVSCIGTLNNCGIDLKCYNPENRYEGLFFAGLDLAQIRDYCVLSIVELVNGILFLRHIKIFQQPTQYAQVMGYLKALQDRWGGFQKIPKSLQARVQALLLTCKQQGSRKLKVSILVFLVKVRWLSLLKQRMSSGRFFNPLLNWERPYYNSYVVSSM